MSFRFKLVTPDRVLFEQEVEAVSLPTPDGQIEVLTHHVPLSTLLATGIIQLHEAGKEEEVAVSGGFVTVGEDGTLTVLAETAERGEELDLSVIQEAKQRAMDVMKKAVSTDDLSFAMAAAALERELSREKLALKRKHHGK